MSNDPSIMSAETAASSWKSPRILLHHILCILALMWVPLANGQPHFFYDTTNYIRAADLALHLYSGKRVSTVWTDRYENQLPGANKELSDNKPKDSRPENQSAAESDPPTHNDISSGLVMSGRSPYIGAFMLAGYITSNFWLFVLFQSVMSYILISLALRRFDIVDRKLITGTVVGISAATTLPYYNGLLLADAFAAFGILGFLLLVTPGRLSRAEFWFIVLAMAISVVSHLTHIVMLIAMLGMAILLALLKWTPPIPRRAWLAGFGMVLVGLGSVQITALATEAALGKKPQLLPLLTARFIPDGPGKAFIDAGCDDNRFQVCRVPLGDTTSEAAFISATEPGVGTYLLAKPEERRTMGEEDVAFAWAVFQFDPLGQSAAIFRNTFRQLTWVEYGGLNRGCFDRSPCWSSVPEPVRTELKESLSGQNAWPETFMTRLLQFSVLLSLVIIAYCLWQNARNGRIEWVIMRTWLAYIFIAMLACSAFGGAVVDPQYRYIGRLIWLVPLCALIALIMHRSRNAEAGRDHVQVDVRNPTGNPA
ncbi:MAG: hypothetical protein AAGE37_12670 [Pseudomonadota bacterium]